MKNPQSFSEERLPIDLSLAASGGAEYSTNVITTVSGHEQRNINWRDARSRYELEPVLQDSDQLERLISFFRAHKGKAIGFRFRDWSDYSTVNELIGEGDGQIQTFQLSKSYRANASVDRRIITKPVVDTLKLYVNGAEVAYTCDYSSGKVTLKLAPPEGAKITASFEFDIPVRFDTDFLDLSPESNFSLSIPLIEIKVQV